jgi:hypothetical protein
MARFKTKAQRQAVMAKIRKKVIGKKRRGQSTIISKSKIRDTATTKKEKYNWRVDKRYKALTPGSRKTAWGSLYFENRRNRSDRNRQKKL